MLHQCPPSTSCASKILRTFHRCGKNGIGIVVYNFFCIVTHINGGFKNFHLQGWRSSLLQAADQLPRFYHWTYCRILLIHPLRSPFNPGSINIYVILRLSLDNLRHIFFYNQYWHWGIKNKVIQWKEWNTQKKLHDQFTAKASADQSICLLCRCCRRSWLCIKALLPLKIILI